MKKIIPLLFLLSGISIQQLPGQVDSTGMRYAINDTHNVKVTLFDTDDIFEISLKFDISYYRKHKSDVEYLDAILTYYNNKTDSVTKKIKIRARGEIRRTVICDFPPLLLNFKMKDPKGGEFKGINKLKLVPYCRLGYENYILKEYLAYKLYNLLTEYSFRVRLCKVNLINTARENKPLSQFGFVIEPISLLEMRTGTKEINFLGSTQRNIKPEILDRVAIFNYMIGNTDWSVPIHHNVLELVKDKPEYADKNILVPFDFDYSGFVDADYAVPFEKLPIQSVRQRLFLAGCRSETEFKNELAEFSAKKEAFHKVINEFQYLNTRTKKQLISYLDGFFTDIEKKNRIIKLLLNDCKWFEEKAYPGTN